MRARATSSGASIGHPRAEAYTHILHDKALLKPGVTFRELTERSRPLGDEFVDGRYSVAMHGASGSATNTRPFPTRRTMSPETTGTLQEGMVMCVEALAAPAGGREAVKLEEQVLITADGYEQLSSYPLEEGGLAVETRGSRAPDPRAPSCNRSWTSIAGPWTRSVAHAGRRWLPAAGASCATPACSVSRASSVPRPFGLPSRRSSRFSHGFLHARQGAQHLLRRRDRGP